MKAKVKETILEFMDFLDTGVIVCQPPQWEIAYINEPAAKFLGRSVLQLKGVPLTQGTSDNELIKVLENLKAVSSHTKIPFQKGDRIWGLEWHHPKTKEKTPNNNDMVAVFIREDSQQAEYHDLLNKELDAIINCVFDGIWIIDGQGITLRINNAVEKIADIKGDDIVGRHVSEPRDEGKFTTSVNLKALEEKRPITLIDEYHTGKRCLTSSIPVFNEKGEIWRVVATIRDMSQLEELQQELMRFQEQARLYQDEFKRLEEEQHLSTELVGNSPAIEKVISIIRRLAKVDSTAIILGETGTGKSLVAQAIHDLSPRSNGPFIRVNCGAIPENLIESELFGYEKGSFTGAKQEGKPGMFELAQGGTIFLDEVGELPLLLQVKLLQAVEEQVIFRIGGTKQINLNVRIIAATNRNLEDMVAKGTFREDLYYRLKVLPITIPPLKDRREDIPLLVSHFLKKYNEKMGLAKRFSSKGFDYMLRYHWPGNVRELRTMIEHLMVMSDGNLIMPDDLPSSLRESAADIQLETTIQPLKKAVEELEKKIISRSIEEYKNSYEVAKILKVNQSTVIRKAKKYGLSFSGIN